jgi:hypothetical protein
MEWKKASKIALKNRKISHYKSTTYKIDFDLSKKNSIFIIDTKN